MAEIINTLKNQIERISSVIEGLEDKSKLLYPKEYDFGSSVLNKVISDLSKVRDQLSYAPTSSPSQEWLLSLIRTLTLKG